MLRCPNSGPSGQLCRFHSRVHITPTAAVRSGYCGLDRRCAPCFGVRTPGQQCSCIDFTPLYMSLRLRLFGPACCWRTCKSRAIVTCCKSACVDIFMDGRARALPLCETPVTGKMLRKQKRVNALRPVCNRTGRRMKGDPLPQRNVRTRMCVRREKTAFTRKYPTALSRPADRHVPRNAAPHEYRCHLTTKAVSTQAHPVALNAVHLRQ